MLRGCRSDVLLSGCGYPVVLWCPCCCRGCVVGVFDGLWPLCTLQVAPGGGGELDGTSVLR